jgi:hypothetical protein
MNELYHSNVGGQNLTGRFAQQRPRRSHIAKAAEMWYDRSGGAPGQPEKDYPQVVTCTFSSAGEA